MRMAPFEPAPFRKVIASGAAELDGIGKRLLISLECGHVIVEPVSRSPGYKRKRCKQCREEL